ncbi:MAG: hypothetical protein OXC81_07130 [Betaproteobacteria bacterium]|nr:hypothetical protein [Betaproteobacteria bacterium]
MSSRKRSALAKYGRPEIFNTDFGAQFTSEAFLVLEAKNIKISMRRLRPGSLANVLIERLGRSIKHEEVFLRSYENASQTRWHRQPAFCPL